MHPGQSLVTWQPVLTDHQAYTYEALARASNRPLAAYVIRKEDATRQKQGWADMRVTSIERRVVPRRGGLRFILRELWRARTDVHIFAGAFEEPRMVIAMAIAARLGIKFYLISEPYAPIAVDYFGEGTRAVLTLKARLRPAVYRLYAALLRRGIAGIFAISPLSIAQYARAGIARSKLHPFGYFVPRVPSSELPPVSDTVESGGARALRIVFVGSLIRRKGVDVLLDAVARAGAEGAHLSLDVYGPGDPEEFGIDGSTVRYRGSIPFGGAQQVMAEYDALVVPSRYDGWGVVVNEAICAGTPVLCSDAVGAGVLVDTFGPGRRFAAADRAALTRLLVSLAAAPRQLAEMRARCRAAADAIQPNQAARYMLAVLSAPAASATHVPCPWYRQISP